MSAYSDYKFGLISDSEYAAACRREEEMSEPDEFESEDFFDDDDIDEF